MTNASIALDLHQSLDVEGYIAAQITFYDQMVFNVLTQLRGLLLGQVLYAGIRIDTVTARISFAVLRPIP